MLHGVKWTSIDKLWITILFSIYLFWKFTIIYIVLGLNVKTDPRRPFLK